MDVQKTSNFGMLLVLSYAGSHFLKLIRIQFGCALFGIITS